jgi:hypothetical protein
LGPEGSFGAELPPFQHLYFFSRVGFSLDFGSFSSREKLTATSIAGKTAYYVDREKKNVFIFDTGVEPVIGIGSKFCFLNRRQS